MNKKVFSKSAALLMPPAVFLPTKRFHYFILYFIPVSLLVLFGFCLVGCC